MNTPSSLLNYPINDVLFVIALESEAGRYFDNFNVVFTGIGKVNAAYNLTKAITTFKPKLIVNLGTAGSKRFRKYEVINCSNFVQRDMDVRGLGFKLYETPLSNEEVVLNYGLSFPNLNIGICGTGDSFDTTLDSKIYDVVDMEAYALALISKNEGIDFLSLKFISDGADHEAAESWTTNVIHAGEAFYNVLFG